MLWKILHGGNAGLLEKVGSCEEEELRQDRITEAEEVALFKHTLVPAFPVQLKRDAKSLNRGLQHLDWYVCWLWPHFSTLGSVLCFFVLSLQHWPTGCKLQSWHPGHCKTQNYNSPESLAHVIILVLNFYFHLKSPFTFPAGLWDTIVLFFFFLKFPAMISVIFQWLWTPMLWHSLFKGTNR